MPLTTLFSATLGEDNQTEPPLGPLYIASALQRLGWEVDFRDYQLFQGANAFDAECMTQCLAGHGQVLMISCLVDMLPVVIKAAELIKSADPDTYILLGGPGPTAGARQFLEVFPQLDAIVMGEGEDTITEWALSWGDSQKAGQPIAGLVYRHGGDIVEGGPRNRIRDLQMAPAYGLLDWSQYSAGRIITTRGCPYRCSFCDVAPLWGRKAVYRDLVSAVEEIVMLRDRYGRTAVSIADDTFVLDRERVKAFCHLMIERKVGVKWGCFGRINLMSEELIALMAEAGCGAIFYGIDSGSPAVLDRTFKELAAEQIFPTLQISAKYFEIVEASFIWGYPFESYEDFLHTLELAAQASKLAPKVNIQLHMLSPLPSSPIYREFEGSLAKPEEEDARWLLLPSLLLDKRSASVKQVIETDPRLFPGFYCFPTPNKTHKREKLQEVFSALQVMIGRAMVDERVRSLWTHEDSALEHQLLDEAAGASAAERIGTGLALGAFKRIRQKKAGSTGQKLDRVRKPGLVRQRNDDLLRLL